MSLGESSKAGVEFVLPNDLCNPLQKVILDDTFVDLVQNVRGDACEDVGVWEVRQKGL